MLQPLKNTDCHIPTCIGRTQDGVEVEDCGQDKSLTDKRSIVIQGNHKKKQKKKQTKQNRKIGDGDKGVDPSAAWLDLNAV